MAAIAGDDFGGLYRLRYSPCNFLPEVSVSRQSEWFEQSFYTDADSPLPVVALPCTVKSMSQTISDALLWQVLDDELSDRAVCELIWQRLGYCPAPGASPADPWHAGPQTPAEWAKAYPEAPEFIAERPASVRLTRSIPPPLKQLLKQELKFGGYTIDQLVPRRTRRATAVSWLLAWRRRQGPEAPSAQA
jgi:hypothetical protein